MSDIPIFQSEYEYRLHRADLNFWWPHILEVLKQHHLADTHQYDQIQCGYNPTYPVFLINDIVIKFFGHCPNWQTAFNTEYTAHEYLTKDPTLLTPLIIGKGQLFPNNNASWPYLISTKISGQSWLEANLTFEQKNRIAAEIGQQLWKIHALPIDNKLKQDHQWSKLDIRSAAQKSVLPQHLVDQLDHFMAQLDDFDRCFVNGDMVETHVLIENYRLSGIIDWGDATVTDRHYELGKLLDTFNWDKRLLKTVLDASNWPIKKNFARQSLGLALYRQAVGLTQHQSFDVFYKLPNLLPLEEIATLDELAVILFDV